VIPGFNRNPLRAGDSSSQQGQAVIGECPLEVGILRNGAVGSGWRPGERGAAGLLARGRAEVFGDDGRTLDHYEQLPGQDLRIDGSGR
jgi:hypothetical protein